MHQEEDGKWKDSLFSFLRHGLCHPSLCQAIWCPQILMAQVLTRLKLDWMAQPGPDSAWQYTFRRIFTIVLVYWLIYLTMAPPTSAYEYDENTHTSVLLPGAYPAWKNTVYTMSFWLFTVYTVIVMTRLRRQVRVRYDISVKYPAYMGDLWEDACVSIWCGCCSIAQLARQTADYDKEGAAYCTKTGLVDDVASHYSGNPATVLTV
jgi:PLAC8 family